MKDIHPIVKLLKNHLYATYQLHAVMANKKISPEEGLKLGALTVIDWVCQRLGSDVPDELQVPKPEDYSSFDISKLTSVHLNYGFVIDIIALPDKGIWSLQITEPDLGSDPGNPNQWRKPVAGRILETDVSFVINGKELECGVKTIISDPENTKMADVYRPAFVKKLYNNLNFGLRHIIPIQPKLRYINNLEQLKNALQLYHNENNQLPLLIFTKVKKSIVEAGLPLESLTVEELKVKNTAEVKYDDKGNRVHNIKAEHDLKEILAKEKAKAKGKKIKGEAREQVIAHSIEELRVLARNPIVLEKKPILKQARKVTTEYVFPPYEVMRFAGAFAGFAHVYMLEPALLEKLALQENISIQDGDILVLEPQGFKGAKKIYPIAEVEQNSRLLQKYIFTYPREKAVDFGNIYFLGGARDALVSTGNEAKALSMEQAKRFAMEQEIKDAQWQARLVDKNNELAKLENQINKQKQQLTIAEENVVKQKNRYENEFAKQQKMLAAKDEYIKFLEERIARPHTKKELPDWVRLKLSDHLVLLSKAISTLEAASVSNDRLEEIYDSLEFLAHEFWESRYASLTEEEVWLRSSKKYNKKFEVAPNSDSSINTYPGQYKIANYKEFGGNIVTKDLKFHLKSGNKSEHLVRIYFFFDDARKLIVVGSMPDHLDTVLF